MSTSYLNPSTLLAVRFLATETLRHRRPRQASRVRAYTNPSVPMLPSTSTEGLLGAVLGGLRGLEVSW
ncbi:hypothetical protein HFP72_18370 [Nocardiopsis sp. ARC36]